MDHRELGFYRFQEAVTLLSFDAEFYNANKHRLLARRAAGRN